MEDFTVSITQDLVEVRLDPSCRNPHAKLGGAIFVATMVILAVCALLLLPGKSNSSSMRQNMSKTNIESGDFLVPLGILVVGGSLLLWMGFRWSAAAWPSNEILRCDRAALTISRVPYLDFRNRTWKSRSYAVHDVEGFRFAVYASAKGSSIYGFRFRANGRRYKTLPGLEAPEAQDILKALQGFGMDVVLDNKLQKRVGKELERRGGSVSIGR